MRYFLLLLTLFGCVHEPIQPDPPPVTTSIETKSDGFVWQPRACPPVSYSFDSYFEVAGSAIGTNQPTMVRLYCDSGDLRMTCEYLQVNTNDTIYIVTDQSGFYNIEAENFGAGFMYFELDTIRIWGVDSVRIESVSLRL